MNIDEGLQLMELNTALHAVKPAPLTIRLPQLEASQQQ